MAFELSLDVPKWGCLLLAFVEWTFNELIELARIWALYIHIGWEAWILLGFEKKNDVETHISPPKYDRIM